MNYIIPNNFQPEQQKSREKKKAKKKKNTKIEHSSKLIRYLISIYMSC